MALTAVKSLPAQEAWTRSPGGGRSPGEGSGCPLQCSCLDQNSRDRGAVGCSPWGLVDHHCVTDTPTLSVTFRCRRGSEGGWGQGDGGELGQRGLALGVGLQPHLLTFPPAQVARQEGGSS